MGLLKKFFSIGGKKSKKQSPALSAHNTGPLPAIPHLLTPQQEEENEAAVSRLLRSSSARYAVQAELDYASLPPLPHPIHNVVRTSVTPTPTVSSVSQRSTYTVTIRERTLHSRTEFPNANPPMDDLFTPKQAKDFSARRRSKSAPITPRDQNRLHGLRQDPSVASLLNAYDEHGCLDSKVFSNTPPLPENAGRIQRRSTGSTLRQLLGQAGECGEDTSHEDDISWAEKVLGEEADDGSSTSSLALQTPTDPQFTDDHSNHAHHDITISTDCDASDHINYPTFSSLEVELSSSVEAHVSISSPYMDPDPATPQRASQVFKFLTEKKRRPEDNFLPVPLIMGSPPSRFSSDTASTNSQNSDIPPSGDTQVLKTILPIEDVFPSAADVTAAKPLDQPSVASNEPIVNNLHKRSLRETSKSLPAIVTNTTGQTTRGPRGPRAPPQVSRAATNKSSGSHKSDDQGFQPPQPHVEEQLTSKLPRHPFGKTTNSVPLKLDDATKTKTNESCGAPARPTHRCSSLVTNVNSGPQDKRRGGEHPGVSANATKYSQKRSFPKLSPGNVSTQNKENNCEVLESRLPKTPSRPLGFRPLAFVPPSPASSSELSPVAQQMMADLRTQRMQARQREKQRSRWGSSQSKIRF